MKRRLFVWIAVLCMPLGMVAQDDIYFVPSRKAKTEKAENIGEKAPAVTATTVYTEPAETVVIVKNKDGKLRDVDEYNRRYDSDEYDFQMEGDTLYVEEAEEDGLDGEWVTGEFDGSASDYEYATRIIRFRNPRFAVSISSPFYWDIVYGAGMNSWDWNVYTDGMYAYAFPTFSNPLWWDWRYNSFGWGWYGPGWGGYYAGFWGGWYSWGYPGYWYSGYWHPGHWHPGYYPGHSYWGHHVTYTNRTSYGPQNRTSYGSRSSSATVRRSGTSVRRGSGTSTRVVGTRSSSTRSSGTSVRSSGASVRRGGTYTRPSSTRGTAVNGSIRNSSTRGSSSTVRSSGQTYNTFDATNRNSNTGIRTSTGSSTRINSGFTGSSRSSGSFSGGGFSGTSRSSGGSVRSSGSRR